MTKKNNYQLLHSNKKHESLIPKFNTEKYCHLFFKERKNLSVELKSKEQQSDLQLTQLTESLSDHFYYKVEKRFIVYGDFKLQDEKLLNALTEQQHHYLPTLLLNFSLINFQKKCDYNSLNSAVRIIDHLQNKLDKLDSNQQYYLNLLLKKEQGILLEIYNENC